MAISRDRTARSARLRSRLEPRNLKPVSYDLEESSLYCLLSPKFRCQVPSGQCDKQINILRLAQVPVEL